MAKKIEYWMDTNEIIYYLRFNEQFSPRTRKLVELAQNGKLSLKISPLVISECVFILMGPQFRQKKEDIAKVLISFLNLKGIEPEEKSVIEESLNKFTIKGIDFVDAYLAAHAKSVSPANVVTTNQRDFRRLGVNAETPDEIIKLLEELEKNEAI